jgi:hypothetical protein
MTMFSHFHVIQSWVVSVHKTIFWPATNKCVLTLHLYLWGICRTDGLDVIIGRGEFPLYFHTHTSYKGHHISYTECQRIYLLVSSGWRVKFTTDLHLVPDFRMCGASSPHSILSSWNPCSKQKLLTIIVQVSYKTLCNSQGHWVWNSNSWTFFATSSVMGQIILYQYILHDIKNNVKFWRLPIEPIICSVLLFWSPIRSHILYSKWWLYSLSPYRQQSICLVKFFLQNAMDKQTMNVEQQTAVLKQHSVPGKSQTSAVNLFVRDTNITHH